MSVNDSFIYYQSRYQTFLPLPAQQALCDVQEKFYKVASGVDKFFQIPELALKVMQFALNLFSCFCPSIDSCLSIPNQLCKDFKNVTSVIKGIKSVEGILNSKFRLRSLIINALGLFMCIISGLSLAERLKLLQLTSIKATFAAIPIFGILPWGGLLPLAIVGVTGLSTLFTIEKMHKLKEGERRINQDKLPFWSARFDLSKVQEKQEKFQAKALNLKEEIAHYQTLALEGKRLETSLILQSNSIMLVTCQKALSEIEQALEERQERLEKYEHKFEQYDYLQKNWDSLDPQALEKFQQAKRIKWQKKLKKLAKEKKETHLSLVNKVMTLAKQVSIILGVAAGYGVVVFPLAVNIALDAFSAGTSMYQFFSNKKIKKIIASSIHLTQYVSIPAESVKSLASVEASAIE